MNGKVLFSFSACVAFAAAATIIETGNLEDFDGRQNNSSNANGPETYDGTPFGPFTPYLKQVPDIEKVLLNNRKNLYIFPQIDSLLSLIPDDTSYKHNHELPIFRRLPDLDPHYKSSKLLGKAQQSLRSALGIYNDLGNGLRDAIDTALHDKDNRVKNIRVILNTIASCYSKVALTASDTDLAVSVFMEGLKLVEYVGSSIDFAAASTDGPAYRIDELA